MKRHIHTHAIENTVIFHQTHRPMADILLPIGVGGKKVYVTHREAKALAIEAQALQILGILEAERNARLRASLNRMRSVANNPLLATV